MRYFFLIVFFLALVGCATVPMIVEKQDELPAICKAIKPGGPDVIGDSYEADRQLWIALNNYYRDQKRRKLAVFLDGTANDKKDGTNIRELYRLAVEQACLGSPVIPYYDKGVGAKWFDKVRGGATGEGASLNIRQAYRFLVEAYNTGDEIFLLGFSRGAFTARSLNGFIEFAGLLDKKTIKPKWTDALPYWLWSSDIHFVVKNIFDVYKTAHDGTIDFEGRLKKEVKDYEKTEYPELHFYDGESNVKVKAIGVFDTVPALGLGSDEDPDNHRLDLYAEYGFHALSLDERRNKFRLLRFNDLNVGNDQKLAEVWFPGGHADVGGGYKNEEGCNSKDDKRYNWLKTIPLNWMLSKFKDFKIFPAGRVYEECSAGKLHDEFFDTAMWKKFGLYRRRPMNGDTIHESVAIRMNIPLLTNRHEKREPDGKYKPQNLKLPLTNNYYLIEPDITTAAEQHDKGDKKQAAVQ
jgi:hypothetical protein